MKKVIGLFLTLLGSLLLFNAIYNLIQVGILAAFYSQSATFSRDIGVYIFKFALGLLLGVPAFDAGRSRLFSSSAPMQPTAREIGATQEPAKSQAATNLDTSAKNIPTANYMRKIIPAITFIVCAVALLFPPWGYYSHFEGFAFVFTRNVPLADYSVLSASIMWPTLGIEIGVILFLGLSLYSLARK